jgi:hypothetical protein
LLSKPKQTQAKERKEIKKKEIKEKEKKEKEKKEKEKNNSEKKSALVPTDFIDRIVNAFAEEHGSYIILNPGIERTMARKLSGIYEKLHPEANTEEALAGLKNYFKQCVNINDAWLRDNMSLSIIVSKFNQINKIINNGRSSNKPKGATPNEIAETVAEVFGDPSERKRKNYQPNPGQGLKRTK